MEDPEFYLDKKWRVSKRDHQFGHDPTLIRSSSQKHAHSNGACSSTSSKTPSFIRSFSQKRSKHGSAGGGGASSLSKSSSVRINHHASPPSSGLRRSASTRNHYSDPDESGGLRKKGSAFTKKCSAMAKEQKARFYIMKRCVAMLVRWRKHGDS